MTRAAVVPALRSRKGSVPGLMGSTTGLDEGAGDEPSSPWRVGKDGAEGQQLHARLQSQRCIVQFGELRVVFVGEADAGEPRGHREVAATAHGPDDGRLHVRGEQRVRASNVACGGEVQGVDEAGREAIAADVAGHAAAAFERRDPGVDGLEGGVQVSLHEVRQECRCDRGCNLGGALIARSLQSRDGRFDRGYLTISHGQRVQRDLRDVGQQRRGHLLVHVCGRRPERQGAVEPRAVRVGQQRGGDLLVHVGRRLLGGQVQRQLVGDGPQSVVGPPRRPASRCWRWRWEFMAVVL